MLLVTKFSRGFNSSVVSIITNQVIACAVAFCVEGDNHGRVCASCYICLPFVFINILLYL